jgi:hypothetical protein
MIEEGNKKLAGYSAVSVGVSGVKEDASVPDAQEEKKEDEEEKVDESDEVYFPR